MLKIAVLITCFNRKEKTLECLDSLYNNTIPSGYSLEVFLVDDGCSDGTTAAVKANYPVVNIILGNGNLYWTGGMRLAWSAAAQKGFDYYLWLNNDVKLFKNSVGILLSSALKTNNNAVICSAMTSDSMDKITYGGTMVGARETIKPNGSLNECQIINGNCVIVPNIIFKSIGNFDKKFHHAIGDHDYGLRAIEAGFKCYVAPEIIGICNANLLPPKWCLKEYSFLERFKFLYSPLGNADPFVYFFYIKRHFGLYQAVKQFISTHIRVVLPQLWRQ